MSKLDAPARLTDTASDTTDGVRAVLRAGRRGLPGPDDLARLAARLPLGPLPAPSASPFKAPTPMSAPIAAPSMLPGALVGALLALGVVGGVWWRDAASSRPSGLPAPSGAANGAASIAAPGLVEAGRAEPHVEDALPPPLARASTSSPARRGAPAAPSGELPSAAELGAARSGEPASNAGSRVEEEETEVHFLQRAQSALGADPGYSLALTGEHARRFPGGSLGEEREFIAVRALVALGRTTEARGRAAQLLERFPSSAYRGRLESLGLGESFQKNEPGSPRTE